MNTPICPYCNNKAKLVSGAIIYPHRRDLAKLNFWSCESCEAYVGCHKLNKKWSPEGTIPLGTLANAKLRAIRSKVHKALDPHWQYTKLTRKACYAKLAKDMHLTAEQGHVGLFTMGQCAQALYTINEWSL